MANQNMNRLENEELKSKAERVHLLKRQKRQLLKVPIKHRIACQAEDEIGVGHRINLYLKQLTFLSF